MGVEVGLHLGRGIGFHKTFQDGGGCLNKATKPVTERCV